MGLWEFVEFVTFGRLPKKVVVVVVVLYKQFAQHEWYSVTYLQNITKFCDHQGVGHTSQFCNGGEHLVSSLFAPKGQRTSNW